SEALFLVPTLLLPCLVSGSSSSVGALKNFNKKYLSEYVKALPYAFEMSSCCPYTIQFIGIFSSGFSVFCQTLVILQLLKKLVLLYIISVFFFYFMYIYLFIM